MAERWRPEDVRHTLWTDGATAEKQGAVGGEADPLVLEQYKLYVEMADRLSARRAIANSYFLTLHTAIATLVALFWRAPTHDSMAWLALLFLGIALGLCLAWILLVRSYRQLSARKFAVIGALEERLPASPWWNGEWLGRVNERRYLSLSYTEMWVPILFAVAYAAAGTALLRMLP